MKSVVDMGGVLKAKQCSWVAESNTVVEGVERRVGSICSGFPPPYVHTSINVASTRLGDFQWGMNLPTIRCIGNGEWNGNFFECDVNPDVRFIRVSLLAESALIESTFFNDGYQSLPNDYAYEEDSHGVMLSWGGKSAVCSWGSVEVWMHDFSLATRDGYVDTINNDYGMCFPK